MVFNLDEYICKHTNNIKKNYLKVIKNELKHYKAFFIACYIENNLQILKNIINENNIDINYLDKNKNNGFCVACKRNPNIKIIKFLIKQKIDVTHKNIFDHDRFLFACSKNDNIDIIKYLFNYLSKNTASIDSIFLNYKYDNPFLLACEKNKNINIIKYLVSDVKIDINVKNKCGINAILAATYGNNTEILNFLIEEVRMNITQKKFKERFKDRLQFSFKRSNENGPLIPKWESEIYNYLKKRKYTDYFLFTNCHTFNGWKLDLLTLNN